MSVDPQPADPTPVDPTPPVTKDVLNLTDSEKQNLRRRKRRRQSVSLSTDIPFLTSPSAPGGSPPYSPGAAQSSQPHSPTPIFVESDLSPDLHHSLVSQPPPAQTPFASTSDPLLARPGFFSAEPPSSSPLRSFQVFNRPADDPQFPSFDAASLLTTTALQLGQALGGFSRLLTLEPNLRDQSQALTQLQSDLTLLRSGHAALQTDHTTLKADHLAIQTQLNSQTAQNTQLQTQVSDLTTELTFLRQQTTDQAAQVIGLQGVVGDLEGQMKQKDEALHRSAEVHRKLEEEVALLRAQRQTAVEDSRQGIIEEYKRSQELMDAVVAEYDKGYSFAKGLIRTAGQDPKALGFSSDEDAAP